MNAENASELYAIADFVRSCGWQVNVPWQIGAGVVFVPIDGRYIDEDAMFQDMWDTNAGDVNYEYMLWVSINGIVSIRNRHAIGGVFVFIGELSNPNFFDDFGSRLGTIYDD